LVSPTSRLSIPGLTPQEHLGKFELLGSTANVQSLLDDTTAGLFQPAALAIHPCIGQVYSFSVFKIPFYPTAGSEQVIAGGRPAVDMAARRILHLGRFA